jgi:multiple sugar transport system permease protein
MNKHWQTAVFHLVVASICLAMLYPLIWMISASLKPETEIFTTVGLFPRHITIQNYLIGWKGYSGVTFGRFFLNSMFISTSCIVGNVLSCSMAAYAFAKLRFRFSAVLFAIMMLTLMVPMQVRLIPQYIIFNTLGWVNTYLPLIVPRLLAVDGFFVFLLVQFMRNIPNEMLESPRMDGCGTFKIYLYFMMPLSVPALIAVAIFTFIWSWNNLLGHIIYLSDPRTFTVTLGLRFFIDAMGKSTWGALFAMATLSLIPLFFIFIFFQKHLVEGLTLGAMKG